MSEISHLFLSDVRKKVTGRDSLPARTPPGRPATGEFHRDPGMDLTPEEFAHVFRPTADREAADRDAKPTPTAYKPARVVIAHHLGETMVDRVRDLAVAIGDGGRVGVVYADAASVRVCCVEPTPADASEGPPVEAFDAQRLREVLVELDQDVTAWLLVVTDPKPAGAKAILAAAADWTLLSGVDHDGIVSAYRTLKGCCDAARPRLSISVFGATDAEEADQTYRKLAGVCEQFLKINVDSGLAAAAADAADHCLLEAAVDAPDHWAVLTELLDTTPVTPVAEPAITPVTVKSPNPSRPAIHVSIPVSGPVMKIVNVPTPPPTQSRATADDGDTVFDLPDADASPAGILRAVVRGTGDWIESPVKPPSLPEATVAVGRDRRLVLLAVARPGLGELRSVAMALRWMTENRGLIAMAVPQLSIDAFAEPRLHLLVDHLDADADALQPLLAAGSVTVAAYRRVKWAGKSGLLLNAA